MTLFTHPDISEPDITTDAGRILAALRWAKETGHKPTLPGADPTEIPGGSVSGIELSRLCIDYRARISHGLRKRCHSTETKLVTYTDWRGKKRRIGCFYLTNYEAELPDGYRLQEEFPW